MGSPDTVVTEDLTALPVRYPLGAVLQVRAVLAVNVELQFGNRHTGFASIKRSGRLERSIGELFDLDLDSARELVVRSPKLLTQKPETLHGNIERLAVALELAQSGGAEGIALPTAVLFANIDRG